MKTLILAKPRGFALQAASDFYSGFVPGSGMAAAETRRLTLAFRLDHSFEAVAVALREEGGSLIAEYAGTNDPKTLARQVARILGLEVDGEEWLALGRREPVVGKLQAEFPGFFTAAKSSPYDAAAWGVLSPRMNMHQAAKLKMRIAEEHGDKVELLGGAYSVFPSPEQVSKIDSFPGLPGEKLARLKAVAVAVASGKLDAERLRAMQVDEALAELQSLRGVGPWTASHVLFRGAALIDALPTTEPRVLHGFADAYGLPSATKEKFEETSARWRPFRMWVCILLARHLGRIGGWNQAGLTEERRAAAKLIAASSPRPGRGRRAAAGRERRQGRTTDGRASTRSALSEG
jgi:DNA-3-methyladenine glycosylase II